MSPGQPALGTEKQPPVRGDANAGRTGGARTLVADAIAAAHLTLGSALGHALLAAGFRPTDAAAHTGGHLQRAALFVGAALRVFRARRGRCGRRTRHARRRAIAAIRLDALTRSQATLLPVRARLRRTDDFADVAAAADYRSGPVSAAPASTTGREHQREPAHSQLTSERAHRRQERQCCAPDA